MINLLREKIRELLDSKSIDFFYSSDFGSANSQACSDWRDKLQREVEKRSSASTDHSISHSNYLGGAALIDRSEGVIGFDLEQTNRVTEAVALRVSDARQVSLAPTPAALFVAKEAAFKSLLGPRQPKVLSEVEIINWFEADFEPPIYRFTAQLKSERIQWFGACFLDQNHTLALCRFPHSTKVE